MNIQLSTKLCETCGRILAQEQGFAKLSFPKEEIFGFKKVYGYGSEFKITRNTRWENSKHLTTDRERNDQSHS